MARKKAAPIEEPEQLRETEHETLEAEGAALSEGGVPEQLLEQPAAKAPEEGAQDDSAVPAESAPNHSPGTEGSPGEAAPPKEAVEAGAPEGQPPDWPPGDDSLWPDASSEASMKGEDGVHLSAPEEELVKPPEREICSVDLSAPAEIPPTGEGPVDDPLEDEAVGDAGAALRTAAPEDETVALPEELAQEEEKPVEKSDRQKFFDLKFNRLDRGLTPEERQEWNSIYASYRGRSALRGTITGIDPLRVNVWNRETEEMERQTMYCAIVIPYRVRIVIPATEMWDRGWERPDFVLQNMVGSSIDFIVTKVDRESGFAIASRRLALRARRYYFAHRPNLNAVGTRVKCRVMSVGPRRALIECYGHDLNLTQRELRYTAIPDLRDEYHPGQELECVVKVYDPDTDRLEISVKETESNPYEGAEQRHPVGSRRQAMIAGKYGGGVFCNMVDGTVCMCNYSYQHDDSDFAVGDTVILVVQRFDEEKKQMYGKILSKW